MVGGKSQAGIGIYSVGRDSFRQLEFSFAHFASFGGRCWDRPYYPRRLFLDEDTVQAYSAGTIAEDGQKNHFLVGSRAETNDFRKQLS